MSIPSKVTQSSSCLQEHHSPQLDTASADQVHQSYIFCNKNHLANTAKSGTVYSLLMILFAVNFKCILEIFCSLSNTSPSHMAFKADAVMLLIHVF
jgi:hypothetical protein